MTPARTVPIDLMDLLTHFTAPRGLAVEDLLVRAGISPMLLREEHARVTEDQLVALVQQVWRITDDEMFGIGRHPLPRGTFRLLCYALLGAPDLRGALDRLSGFLRAIPAIPLEIDLPEHGDEVALLVTLQPRDELGGLSVVIGLGATARLLAWMLRLDLPLRRVDLPFGRPADAATLETLLDGPLVFDADRAALVLDRSCLGAPVMRDERDIEELVATSPRALLARPHYELSTSDQVRRLIEVGLRDGAVPSADDIAGRLATSPPTLRRRLAEEDTNVRDLTDAVRRDAAIAAITQGDEAVGELSERLGFSEPSAFTRAFRRWTGSSPAAYRRRIGS